MPNAVTGAIYFYQRHISPLFGPRCKYYPSCSQYGIEACEVHGVAKGLILTAWRICRCNPLSSGGVDHVPDPGRWKYDHPKDIARFIIDENSSHDESGSTAETH
ncbi:membrane protein insertion efficiency factor YidD [Actinomyces vulturis]|uniref:membrane protein insertion efficiency factor YidD n=1 Tax=Actinomyces vulturis TaxID=1857645 RepID=UPI0009F38F3A|nr:membrane protein insertion efficiency factor YidD [Actinomyces vulturis]